MIKNDNGSTIDECREALRAGRTLDDPAGQLRCDPAHLARLLGIQVQPTVNMVAEPSCDLWAADKEVL